MHSLHCFLSFFTELYNTMHNCNMIIALFARFYYILFHLPWYIKFKKALL